MKEPVIPQDDKARVKTLQCLNILDTQREERFDRIA
ncbi:MAG TPA: GGDEF domain-containing protein, partial [Alteromonas australica]|nr:GGDEF domain-containing protein [Alteromonas australica]